MTTIDQIITSWFNSGFNGAAPAWVGNLCLILLSIVLAIVFSGIIGFVSLIIPHIMRLLVGPKNRRLIPLSLLGGAVFMILCDLISRTAAAPAEIAVGAITQVTGAPFFLYLLWKERRREERD